MESEEVLGMRLVSGALIRNLSQMGIRDMSEERGGSEFIKQQHYLNGRLTVRRYTPGITNAKTTNANRADGKRGFGIWARQCIL